ncbi:hypothetical protein ACFLTS_05170 [Chloroflexota bacterium]
MINRKIRPAYLWHRGKDVYTRRVSYAPGGIALGERSYKISAEEFDSLLYNPMDYPDLPNAFAKVKDEKTAKKFVEGWGLLGYTHLKNMAEAEPLDWVIQQAKSVKFVMNLIERLNNRSGNLGELIRFLKEESVNGKDAEFRRIRSRYITGYYNLVIGTDSHVRAFFAPAAPTPDQTQSLLSGNYNYTNIGLTDDDIVKEFTRRIITTCVNENTINIRPFLDVKNGDLTACITYEALIEVIWYQVGDIGIRAQHGTEMRVCEECGDTFLARDDRQRFCPALEMVVARKQSTCGLRYRQRKARQKGQTNEEAHNERPHSQEIQE